MEFFFNLRTLLLPCELLSQLSIAAGQFQETGMSVDGLGNKLQIIRADALAVVGAVFVSLKAVVRAIGGGAGGTLWFNALLAKTAADHGVDLADFLQDIISLLLNRR